MPRGSASGEAETPRETRYAECIMEYEEFTHRREFFFRFAKAFVAFAAGGAAFNAAADSQEMVQPEMMIFKDDGVIPKRGIHLAPPVTPWPGERNPAFSRCRRRLPANLEPVLELVSQR